MAKHFALPHLAEPDTPFVHDAGPTPALATPPTPANLLDPLYRQHAAWLTGLLRLRYGREAAEDLLQETFLRAAQADTQTPVRHPRAWLLTIAVNAARDQARRRAVRPQLAPADDHHSLDQHPAGSDQDETLLLKQVVLALPPHLRAVFLLSRFGGLTYAEIGRRLDVSIKTVEWRMTQALKLCAARLRD